MASDSIFTKIINREIPATIRYEDDTFIAIDDIHPVAPVHVLLITKQPFASLEKIPMDDISLHAQILVTARKVAGILGIGDNYKLFMNVGDRVQQVHHIHLHIYGGWPTATSLEQLDQDSQKLINA